MSSIRILWTPPGGTPPPHRTPSDDERAEYEGYRYEWCRAHQEWHRPPECPIDETGAPAPYWEDEEDS